MVSQKDCKSGPRQSRTLWDVVLDALLSRRLQPGDFFPPMTLIQGYLFRQIALPVVAAVGALCGIGLLSQSLDQLEVIVERGQSVWIMLKLTLLAVPQLSTK